MAVNKVNYGNNTLLDVSNDTVTASTLLSGYTAHDNTGTQVTGNVSFITYYTGTSDPSASLGNDGDIYLKVVS